MNWACGPWFWVILGGLIVASCSWVAVGVLALKKRFVKWMLREAYGESVQLWGRILDRMDGGRSQFLWGHDQRLRDIIDNRVMEILAAQKKPAPRRKPAKKKTKKKRA
jgi:hypothetical protein